MIKKILRNPQAVIGLVIIIAIVIIALFAPILSPNDPEQIDAANKFAKAGGIYPLGTDQLGRCELSRLIYGARYSIFISLPTLLLVSILGVLIGTLCACAGKRLNAVIEFICDVFISFPAIIVGIAIVGIMGNGMSSLIIAVVVAQWAWYAKVVRSFAIVEMHKDYITAAKLSGSGTMKIVFKHIIPNIISQVIIFFSTGVAGAIIMISSLAFLGVGLPVGTPEWGSMLNEAKANIYSCTRLLIYPGACILVTTAGFNLFGEALRDILTPKEETL